MNLQDQLLPVKEKLQKAIELELATIPPYLTALFSIRPGTNAMAASIIRSVVMEEMLHLLLAGNLLSAVGGSVKLGKNNIPVYPVQMEFQGKQFKNRQFDIHLAAFSEDTISVFLQIELPDGWGVPQLEFDKITVPGFTIGEFYRGIKDDLAHLCNTYGEQNVFTGKKEHQVSEEYFWRGGGTPIIIANLATAAAAIDLIIEQGEGTTEPIAVKAFSFAATDEVPHYFRFNEIYHGRLYSQQDDPHLPPTGAVIDIDYQAVFPIKTSCKSSDLRQFPELDYLNNLFNNNYATMLSQLEEGFNGNPAAFYTAILNGMHKLSPLAYNLVQLPIPGDPKGRHAAPSFEWHRDV
ncbi:ferritin-like domain-containing protein [Chitinophaga varians]|uniref:ferritin-like domain-containing protein n=1 Tax=Chitinophaga varians TaxID=2202339 RepID=UPI00165F87A2|nr:ferritin-like protein [Chitinophaga varians]MBC9909756.1 ferritin-like protein [Chitinophaga varians]